MRLDLLPQLTAIENAAMVRVKLPGDNTCVDFIKVSKGWCRVEHDLKNNTHDTSPRKIWTGVTSIINTIINDTYKGAIIELMEVPDDYIIPECYFSYR